MILISLYSDRKIIGDLVFGPVVFHGKDLQLIETAEFARLREIKQLSTVYLFQQSANHTRWDHSIGVAGLVKAFLAAQPAGLISIPDQNNLISAALLHDIGHAAWSHVGEIYSYLRGEPINHDELSAEIVRGTKKFDKYFQKWDLPRVRDIITDKDQREKIAMLIEGSSPITFSEEEKRKLTEREIKEKVRRKVFLGNIINGPADFDKVEFLIRDSFMSRSAQGLVDLRGILKNMGIVETSIGSKVLAFLNLHFAECMISAKELLYQGVYLETKNLIAEEMLIRAIYRAYKSENIYNFWFSTDNDVMEKLHEFAIHDSFIERVCKMFRICKIYDLVSEINLNDRRLNKQSRDNIKYLGSKIGRRKLLQLERDVCTELGLNEGDVIIGCWVWVKHPISDAAFHIDGKDTTVDYESRFLEALTQKRYVDSRSRILISIWDKVKIPKSTVLEKVLEILRIQDYTLL